MFIWIFVGICFIVSLILCIIYLCDYWWEKIFFAPLVGLVGGLLGLIFYFICFGAIPGAIWEYNDSFPAMEATDYKWVDINVLPGVEPSFLDNSDQNGNQCYYAIGTNHKALNMPVEYTEIIQSDKAQVKVINYEFSNRLLRFFFVNISLNTIHYEIYVPNTAIAYDYHVNFVDAT